MKKLILLLLIVLATATYSQQTLGEYIEVDASGKSTFTNDILMSDSGATTIEIRPTLNTTIISGQSNVPTAVTVGICPGYSLPIWNSDNEELYFDIAVPQRWDGASDITAHIHCLLASAQDANAHTFQLQLTWDKFTTDDNEIVPASGEHDVGVNTNTAISANQYTSYSVDFTINYDVDTPDDILARDNLLVRIRRITETGDNTEIAGEVIITHLGLVFNRDKIGE
ncbi:MAG: hypothetical protein KAT68_17365 [Bacteroidales bacterium]|nr:hypothetical protein [Bacteroidales bacterium]